jgi:hypothetical protein
MKKLLAFILVLGLATVANAAMLSFQAPAEVLGGETFTVNIVSDAALDYFTLSIALTGDFKGLALGAVNAGFDSLASAGTQRDGSVGNVFIKSMLGQTNATSASVEAGVVGSFSVTAADVLDGMITVDDYAGGGLGGPPVATKILAGGTTTISTIQMEPVSVKVVPEPMTMSLLSLGGLALIRRRRA